LNEILKGAVGFGKQGGICTLFQVNTSIPFFQKKKKEKKGEKGILNA